MRKYKDAHERLADLIDQAWDLPESLIASLTPGESVEANIERVTKLLDPSSLVNPFTRTDRLDLELLKVLRDPLHFRFTCKHLLSLNGVDPLELHPMHAVWLHELWWRQFPMLLCSRGAAKTSMMGLFCLLKTTFCQGVRIVVVGKAFRQSKQMFEGIERLWHNSPVYRDMVGRHGRSKENGPRQALDRFEFVVGDSVAIFLPMGDGETIRGLRANVVISDEFQCLDKDTIIETDRGLMRIGDVEPELGTFALQQQTGNPIAPSEFVRTPEVEAYKVTTKYGFDFICSSIHRVLTTKGWKVAKDLTENDYLVFENKYQFPTSVVEKEGLTVTPDLAWLLGVLTAEGYVAGEHTTNVKGTDPDYIERTASVLGTLIGDGRVKYVHHDAYVDRRGWDCKAATTVYCTHKKFRDKLESLGLDRVTAHTKRVPWCILQSPREQVVSYLSGLFEGDGSAFAWKDGNRTVLGIAFYSVSEALVREVQVLLWKLGLLSYKTSRRSKISENPQWMLRLNGVHAHKLAALLKIPKWEAVLARVEPPHDPPNKGAVLNKASGWWMAKGYSEGKIVHLGTFDTKEQAAARVAEEKDSVALKVRKVELLPGTRKLFDFVVPDTHAFFGNGFVQHNSINEDVYSKVVQGFGAVASDPMSKVKNKARERILKRLGLWSGEMDAAAAAANRGNQSVLAGTMSFSFNQICRYHREYRQIIGTRGDKAELERVLHGPVPDGFDWRAYSVIRVPYSMMPAGFMDESTVARAKATTATAIYLSEFETIPIDDSDGFFKRSKIERAKVGGECGGPPAFPSCGEVEFSPALSGAPDRRYVIGIDPAMERDNFAIVVVELQPDHRRVVHCWTTNKKRHVELLRLKGEGADVDYWQFCARKIRDVMKRFATEEIMMDSQGGGGAIREKLADPKWLEEGELPVYEVRDPEKPKDTDYKNGHHVLRMVNFRDNRWLSEANWGLRKDIEEPVLIFPRTDEAVTGLAVMEDNALSRRVVSNGSVVDVEDTLTVCIEEIEELIDELTLIQHSATGTGLEKWDVPSSKDASHGKGRLRKDRYSALLLANAGARRLAAYQPPPPLAWVPGGFIENIAGRKKDKDRGRGPLYTSRDPARAARLNAGRSPGGFGRVVNG